MKQWLPRLLLDYWAALMLNGFYGPDESAINLDHVQCTCMLQTLIVSTYLVDTW